MNRIYNTLWNDNIAKIREGNHSIDTMIGNRSDKRRGLSLIMRVSPDVRNRYSGFTRACRSAEPDQYYYPESDYHVTMLSIFSCSDTFDIGCLSLDEYISKINSVLEHTKPFLIQHSGITVSSSCILIQGYSPDINDIRKSLRAEMQSMKNTSDLRYQLKTAHSTIARFVGEFKNPDRFSELLGSYRTHDFGVTEIKSVELVLNDWYLSRKHTKTLYEFVL